MICELYGVHPKSIYKEKMEASFRFYKKAEDEEILTQIKTIIEARPTYGYKRVTAMVNRLRKSLMLPKVNKKRIYRVMKLNGLLLPKAQTTREHKPTGKVMTLHSNTRWCSDCFEIKCFNGEKVYVSFVIDSCDREIIAYRASITPMLGEDIELLMLDAVEYRFNSRKTTREIEFLSDRGSIYRAKSTVTFGRALGLKSCFTAAYSPESNGMSEAFVKTIKRDYVYCSDCFDAKTTIKLMKSWIKDYNENAPHSALGMQSPKEYLKAN